MILVLILIPIALRSAFLGFRSHEVGCLDSPNLGGFFVREISFKDSSLGTRA